VKVAGTGEATSTSINAPTAPGEKLPRAANGETITVDDAANSLDNSTLSVLYTCPIITKLDAGDTAINK
jgi:hypothetical protein